MRQHQNNSYLINETSEGERNCGNEIFEEIIAKNYIFKKVYDPK